ncbi:ATP-binding protein [Streptomyces sp. NPDC057638]|uniref:ATP-binding protein n=1 Tax=Streptomyces sp. NPDC057638 TaxID=3346190 RepID=UPI0036B7B4EA
MYVTAARRYALEVPATVERIPQIGRILAAHLRYWRLDPHTVPVCRAVGELLTNVVRHVSGDKLCEVELRWTGRLLVASVADHDPTLPALPSPPSPDDARPPRGGLATVALLSDTWGTRATPTGKVIWFSRRVTETEWLPRLTAPPHALPAPP